MPGACSLYGPVECVKNKMNREEPPVFRIKDSGGRTYHMPCKRRFPKGKETIHGNLWKVRSSLG